MTTTFGALFGGFDAVSIGAIAAGATPLWSIELRPDVAAVAQANFDHRIIVADILSVDPHTVEPVEILHASPPCPGFSLANQQRGETEEDIVLARKVAQFIMVMQPRIFTLENVWLYRKSESWAIILETLYGQGYWVDVARVNAADFAVPQSRHRMIVRAIRGAMVPYLPPPETWVGWYEAIEDLIPGLPDSQFAPWQLARLPEELRTLLVMTSNTNLRDEDCQGGIIWPDMPANTVMASKPAVARALLIPGDNGTNGVTRRGDQPMVTIQTRPPERCPHRAFIVDCQHNNGKAGLTIRDATDPVFTMTASANRVVSMTPRALARFQSFPDWYTLPDNRELACYGIGNAVPPLMYEKVLRGLL